MTVSRQSIRPFALAAVCCWFATCVAGQRRRRSRGRHRQRPAGAALRQPEIGPGQCARRPDQGSRRGLGLHPPGLPVEITAEFENWRRIRDGRAPKAGSTTRCCRGTRTAVVTARAKDQLIAVSRAARADEGDVTAQLQPGVLAQVKRCNGNWCRVTGNGFDGWIPQERLWGVYPNEKVD